MVSRVIEHTYTAYTMYGEMKWNLKQLCGLAQHKLYGCIRCILQCTPWIYCICATCNNFSPCMHHTWLPVQLPWNATHTYVHNTRHTWYRARWSTTTAHSYLSACFCLSIFDPCLLQHCHSVLFLMTVCMQNHIGANRAVLIKPSVTIMGRGCYGEGEESAVGRGCYGEGEESLWAEGAMGRERRVYG